MQYILTEIEYQDLQTMAKRGRDGLIGMPSKSKLLEECTRLADTLETWRGWDGKSEPTAWGCIRSTEYEHYCDECPVSRICPHKHKEWSK